MRLTKLKLAGFKSFVDPTSLALPGQLIGVVGPNGCGKSNVIDAVRWVLGESKASELRGESMQDVIFNGSSTRKPVSRAAVELVFDNSLGRILGQWSQYSELSVKRLLTRSGLSEYYINNQHVRRKDITDLFLGTGLGPRAYAIIGQGTISRIIEAKPDELRTFLEEAAGVTKYKERRKETERRLSDTRDNLLRVEDIRIELGSQIERLESQAAVARQYRQFTEALTHKQHLLWLVRRNDALAEREQMSRELAQAINALEEKNAGLRATEARLEETREANFAANEALHQAQSHLFSVNAEVARLEAEIRHRRDSRHEYESRLAQLKDDEVHWQSEVQKLNEETLRWKTLLEAATARIAQAKIKLLTQQTGLPEAEALAAKATLRVNSAREQQAKAEQALQVERTHRSHAERSLQIMAARRDKLRQEREALPAPDQAHFDAQQESLTDLREQISAAQETLGAAQRDLPQLESHREQALRRVQQVQKEQTDALARRNALEQLQKRVRGEGKFSDWLQRYHLENRLPLWKSFTVAPGWESAVEAVLRERISALALNEVNPAWNQDRPGNKLVLLMLPLDAASDSESEAPPAPTDSTSLLAKISCKDSRTLAILTKWLAGIQTAPDLSIALLRREKLALVEKGHSHSASVPIYYACVTPQGDLLTRDSVTLFSPDAAEHGLLERQREIEAIGATIHALDEQVSEEHALFGEAEERLNDAKYALEELRHELDALQENAHQIQVETLRLSQALDRFRERQAQIDQGLAQIAEEEEIENERLFELDENIQTQEEARILAQGAFDDAKAALENAELALREARKNVSLVDNEFREAEFSGRECDNKISDLDRNCALAISQCRRIADELSRCSETVQAMEAEDLAPRLQESLEQRLQKEESLAAARNALEAATALLRSLEEERMRHEQALDPLREKINAFKLKEQAAELNYEQLAAQLVEANANEAALVGELATARAGALQSGIANLQKSIEALGAVNLAALEELESASERKGFLDAQADDLTQAMQTLENAIRRIDRETRELLQNTFDAVNANFNELFPTLFGGGEARLVMTGEEILDTGIQVMAQPPGKKNSTIQLLSGGEKALTAIALVFAMFQLNPAPFCLLDEVDAPLDDTNTDRFCAMVRRMSVNTQFLFISHSKITMEMAQQLVGVTMQESGVSRIVEVDMEEALRMREQIV